MTPNLAIPSTLDESAKLRMLTEHARQLLLNGEESRMRGLTEGAMSFHAGAFQTLMLAHGKHLAAIMQSTAKGEPLNLFRVSDYDTKLSHLVRHVNYLLFSGQTERCRGVQEMLNAFDVSAALAVQNRFPNNITLIMRSNSAPQPVP